MKHLICILFIVIPFHFCIGQVNLVPNPSFETYTSCPTLTNQLYKATPWYNPTANTPDYFNICAIDSTGAAYMGVPTNAIGYQPARTGNAYAGIGMNSFQREYIGIQLDSSLEANKKYCVEFHLSLSNYAIFSTRSIGAYFSATKLTDYTTPFYLPVLPQVVSPASVLLSDTTNWMLVSGSFIATGGERYMIIGSFLSDTDIVIDTTYPGNIESNIHYYVDDASVTACPDPPIEELFIPTLMGGNQIFEIKGLQGTTELFLYNSLGQIVYKNTNYKNNLNTIEFETGIYYYYLKLNNGEVHKGKLCIVN